MVSITFCSAPEAGGGGGRSSGNARQKAALFGLHYEDGGVIQRAERAVLDASQLPTQASPSPACSSGSGGVGTFLLSW